MNKLKRDKNTYRRINRVLFLTKQEKSKTQGGPETPTLPHKRIVVKNAYSALRQVLKTFNIPHVKKTFGKGIVCVHVRTVMQLENIPLIVKRLLQSCLIEEIGMPLEYKNKFMTLVLFLKPIDSASSEQIDDLFQKSLLGYHHVMTEVQYPTTAAKKIFQKEKPNDTCHVDSTKADYEDTIGINADFWAEFVRLFILCFSSVFSRI